MRKTLYSESEDLGSRIPHFSDFPTSIHSILDKAMNIPGLVNYRWRQELWPYLLVKGNCGSQVFKNYFYFNQLINVTH